MKERDRDVESWVDAEEPEHLPRYLRRLGEPKRLAFAERLAETAYVRPATVEQVDRIVRTPRDPSQKNEFSPKFIAALAFFLFCREAELFGKTGDPGHLERANWYLREADAKSWIYEFYRVDPTHRDDGATLHRTGTTSFILRLPKKNYVLKIIKPPFLGNPNIARFTDEYQDRFSSLGGVAPKVHAGGPRYVLMDFEEGQTLREFRDRELRVERRTRRHRAVERRRLKLIRATLEQLGLHLAKLSAMGIHHLDLNPENVLVRRQVDGRLELVLIDFGYNYLLEEKVGPVDSLAAVQVYTAPELRRDVKRGGSLADVYSFGMLMIDLLAAEGEFDAQQWDDLLDQVWIAYPELAVLIDDLVDADPEKRLIRRPKDRNPFEFLVEALRSSFRVYEEVHLEERSRLQRLFEHLPALLFGDMGRVVELLRKARSLSGESEYEGEAKRLLRWALLTQGVHNLAWLLLGLFVLDDLGLVDLNEKVAWLRGWGLGELNAGTFRENVWGRLVGISFSIVAAHYYLTIFSEVSARGIDRWTEFSLRLNSFCFFLPLAWAIVIEPKHWAFCSALGVAIVGLNNYLTLRTATKADEVMRTTFNLPRSTTYGELVLRDFSNWWLSMELYGLALLIPGILLRLGLAKDEGTYALIVVLVVNLPMLYFNVCSKKGPILRSSLLRLFNAYQRAKLLSAEAVVP